jgi:hypothetical protein
MRCFPGFSVQYRAMRGAYVFGYVAAFHATIHTALGINRAKELRTPDGRPVPITDQGQALTELLG